jgi:electron transport complex protein RnfD
VRKGVPKGIETSLEISTWPHIHGDKAVEKEMLGVVLALLPAATVSVWVFGNDAIRVILYSILSCALFEALGVKLFHGHDSIKRTLLDGSALVSGILLAFNLPANVPFWVIAIGGLVAMFLGKHVFGGLGQNPFNPVLVARVFLLAAFPTHLTSWPAARQGFATWGTDVVTKATPLAILKESGPEAVRAAYSYTDMALGSIGGSLGETSAAALLIGGIYLIYKGIVRPAIPASYLGTFALLSLIAWLINPDRFMDPYFHLIAGGILLGAFFMATDLVTSPISLKGMIIFGAGCGLLNFVIRFFGGYPEGTSFAILIMNGLTPLIDRYIKPKRFGMERKQA